MKRNIFEDFLSQVRAEFPADFLTLDASDLETFGRDWTRFYSPNPSAIVFPRTTEEVSRFLKLCAQNQISVVPSGGRTGLAGGCVASQGEVVLSLSKMNHMYPVDTLAQTVRVQAGAVTEAVHQHCMEVGLTWPVDFASKGSSQVGGNISTNAGGVKVIRFGLTREWVLGLQVVLPSGEILELNGALEKNNTGLDLRQLFIGTEGTLGVITEAVLKLTRSPENLDVFFFGLSGVPEVIRLFHHVRRSSLDIMAFEFLTQNCFDSVLSARGIQSPFKDKYPAYILLEVERPNSADAQSELEAWLSQLFENQLVLDGTLAQSPREAKDLWQIREGISESLTNRGLNHKNDISLPISELENFISDMIPIFAKRGPGLEVFLFGHIGDGNLHVNTIKPQNMDRTEFVSLCKEADRELFELVSRYKGSVSAEHGIGLLKKAALQYSRTPAELALMKQIKQVFDPKGILNPGKIFD